MAIRVLVRSKGSGRDLLLYYVDPVTGREVSKGAGTRDRGEAERAAGRWEQELSNYRGNGDGWKYFRDRYRDEHLAILSKKSQSSYFTALDQYQRRMNPRLVSDVTPDALSRFQASLLDDGLEITSVATYLSHIRAALNWAEHIGIVAKAPAVHPPKQGKREFMRGRPITEAEYRKMLKKCEAPDIRRLMDLIWYSGLRLSEALSISWDSPPVMARIDAKPYPTILYYVEGHKARRDTAVPMTPDLAKWLRKTPAKARHGLIAPTELETMPRVSAAISDVGRAAGVIVDDDGKPASAHDLRRSFGTRWAQKVMPAVLQVLMRHRDISTTLRYYVGISVTDAGRALWG